MGSWYGMPILCVWQNVVAKLEMSGKEEIAVNKLIDAQEKTERDGCYHEAYELDMFVVEMLIYKVFVFFLISFCFLNLSTKTNVMVLKTAARKSNCLCIMPGRELMKMGLKYPTDLNFIMAQTQLASEYRHLPKILKLNRHRVFMRHGIAGLGLAWPKLLPHKLQLFLASKSSTTIRAYAGCFISCVYTCISLLACAGFNSMLNL